MIQPTLFAENTENAETEKVLLYALGDFQSRGLTLADRELPLDRLRGAFKRATDKFGLEEFSDEKIAENLEKLGAKIVKVPNYVAKHPFRITISNNLAEKSNKFYQELINND
ncbi:MAG: hypothetical protein H0V31_05545 [Acidobacteria bacterium]|nr:hypothetical protein [Acidobacteriota bacterium]